MAKSTWPEANLDFMDEPVKKKGKKPFFAEAKNAKPIETPPHASVEILPHEAESLLSFEEAVDNFDNLPTLVGATALGQWVQATSKPYRFFAYTGDTRMAFLWVEGTLSIRLEPNGKWTDGYMTRLKDFGMTVNKAANYASIHMAVKSDPILARKALGSVIFGIMPVWELNGTVQLAWSHLPALPMLPSQGIDVELLANLKTSSIPDDLPPF